MVALAFSSQLLERRLRIGHSCGAGVLYPPMVERAGLQRWKPDHAQLGFAFLRQLSRS